MILRKFYFRRVLLLSLHLLNIALAQNDKPYDDNDWIPITPTNPPDNLKKAQGRVLNLDTPSQNYFPENGYLGKGVQPQHAQDATLSKAGNVPHPKLGQPYKFEPVLPLQPPQYVQQQTQFVQPHLQPQFISQVQQLPYVQTLQQVQHAQRPIQEQTLSQQLVAPPQSTQNYYDTNKNQQQYDSIPLNNSHPPSTNLGLLNQELLGAIQNQKANENANQVQPTITAPKEKEEKESVQLLYVPLENLHSDEPSSQQNSAPRRTESLRKEKTIPSIKNHKLSQLTNIEGDFIKQALAAHKLHQQFKLEEPVLLEVTSTTPQPKKRKPNQPPLSVYMEKEGSADVKDVLQILKQAKSISVQDSVGPGSPKVFVGPSNIDPEGYVKFPLPYLSSVQGNRIERKVEQLPFFVAPLSYKTPDGYSKIPLPSPHVGSVVISTKEQLHEKHTESRQPQVAQTAQNQIVQDFDLKNPFTQFRERPEPNPYLISPNSPQAGQSTLLQFDNGFLGFPDNVPQNYEVSSSKGFTNDYQDDPKGNSDENYNVTPTKSFVPNYQLGVRENSNQYYETTPDYKPTEKTNVRSSYRIPEYRTNDREVSNQNSKESIRDYDIPSVLVESKTSFTPTYRVDPKLHTFSDSPGPNFVTTKSPANVYNFNEELVKLQLTTTTEPEQIIQQFKRVQEPPPKVPEYNTRGSSLQNPYRQVINQYEIEQINTQLGDENTERIEPIRSTTPAVVATRKYVDYDAPTTARSRSRSRHRGRTTTTSTTPNTIAEENYTVLEEFAIQPKTSTVKYTTEVETIPAKVYKLEQQQDVTQTPAPVYIQHQVPLNTQTLNQQALDEQILQGARLSTKQQLLQDDTLSRLNANFAQPVSYNNAPSRQSGEYSHELPYNVPSRPTTQFKQHPVESIASPKPSSDFSGELIDTKISIKATPQTQPHVSDNEDSRLSPFPYSRGQNEEEQLVPVNPYLPGLINNLQDQAVRPLLVPNLLVPTTEKPTTSSPQVSTEEVRVTTTTTEASRIETTTLRRSRGRQRGHTSRYSSTSAPRRSSNRRRPSYTRPTTEREYARTTTEAAIDYEPTRRANTQRQRFRTRGRPLPTEQLTTERIIQTTEDIFKQPSLESGFQGSSGDPQSYMQFDHVVDDQQIVTIKPQQVSGETPIKEYHQVYKLPTQAASTERNIEEISITSAPVVDVKITHPVTERTQEPVVITTPNEGLRYNRLHSNIQPGSVVYNGRNEEVTSRAPVRTRVRSRNRNRFSTTTSRPITPRTTITTTSKPQEEEEEEFYGFIRKPTFNKPAPIIQTTTQHSPPLYSATYQEPVGTLIQLEEDGQNPENEFTSSPSPVEFVGQIRPKFTTTEAQEYSTVAPKVKSRARIRIPNRKTTPQTHQSYNEVKSQRLDDQVTRRSSIIRSRSRGKSHFKPPERVNVRDDDHDVEGGNYPAAYLKNRELTTEKPASFQITIDPAEEEVEDDQVPHSSLYSPQIIRNTDTQWVEASILPAPNDLEIEEKLLVTNSDEQTTMFNAPAEEEEEEEESKTDGIETEIPTTTITTTADIVKATTRIRRKNGRRRGVWKLVNHKPVDSFETAESSNYYSVLNAFDNIEKKVKDDYVRETTSTTITPATTITAVNKTSPKIKLTRRPVTTTTESSIFEALYNMLGLASKASQLPQSKTKVIIHREEITTTTASPTFPEEYTEQTTLDIKQTERTHAEETSIVPQTTPATGTSSTEVLLKSYDAEPEETHEVKTSTSTEISHETEICYKGRCIKSKDDDDPRL
ncbi:mucin-4 [Zophobas morio]|uniref:mucin-4 n=1 Tax=Zophobas morio TaxID=2755281 RepID=UPI0030835C04